MEEEELRQVLAAQADQARFAPLYESYYADIFHMRQEHYELAMRRVNQILDQSLFSQLPELLRETRLEL